jgi:hypothetical protein
MHTIYLCTICDTLNMEACVFMFYIYWINAKSFISFSEGVQSEIKQAQLKLKYIYNVRS